MAASIVIVVGMLKGGTGKTTSAVFTAMTYAQRGRTVHLLDGDNTSQSAHAWAVRAAAAGEPLPFEVERYPFEFDVADHIGKLRETTDVVIVDAGGGSPTYLENAVSAADLLLIPVAPSGHDVDRVHATLQIANRAADRNPRDVAALVFFIRADTRTAEPAWWREQLEADDQPLATTQIRDLVLYTRSYGHTPTDTGEYPALLAEAGLLDEVSR